MVAPTCFGITLPSSGSVPSAFWEMLSWEAVDRIMWMGVLCLVTWCVAISDHHKGRNRGPLVVRGPQFEKRCPTTSWVYVFFYYDATGLLGQDLLIFEDSWSYSGTPHSVGLLWASDRPHTETYTWQHTTLTRDIHANWRDSDPQSQHARGHRP
jgi:hypothetical protein